MTKNGGGKVYLTDELARERQQELLASAREQRQASRARALGRATRRIQRAEQRIAKSRREAVRLRTELNGY